MKLSPECQQLLDRIRAKDEIYVPRELENQQELIDNLVDVICQQDEHIQKLTRVLELE